MQDLLKLSGSIETAKHNYVKDMKLKFLTEHKNQNLLSGK